MLKSLCPSNKLDVGHIYGGGGEIVAKSQNTTSPKLLHPPKHAKFGQTLYVWRVADKPKSATNIVLNSWKRQLIYL